MTLPCVQRGSMPFPKRNQTKIFEIKLKSINHLNHLAMKINTPCLGLLCKGQIEKIENNYLQLFTDTGETNLKYFSHWCEYKKYLTNEVIPLAQDAKYITEPFFDLTSKHGYTLGNIYMEESLNNNVDTVNFKGILFSKYIGCFLDMKGSKTIYTFFYKDNGVPIVKGQFEFDKSTRTFETEECFYLSKFETIFTLDEIYPNVIAFTLSIILEKMIDGKEIVIVPPHGRTKTKHEKYVNDNPTGVEVWDSRMFNSYVRLEGFSVSGHFRHQCVGEGRTKHKMIWINDFEKHGYNYRNFKNLA